MRLRLTICRHGLPEVKVVWNLELDSSPTTSRFLEDVNEVFPIESQDWGLEDYAVELSGFELLHFQSLASTLKEDDSVLIRPLLADDLRQRRCTGRHQISADGRHLVDGVSFGRPRLKAPRDRPDIDIPPRKRRRVLACDSDDINEEDSSFGGEEDRDSEPNPGSEGTDEEQAENELAILANEEEARGIISDVEEFPPREVHVRASFEDEDEDHFQGEGAWSEELDDDNPSSEKSGSDTNSPEEDVEDESHNEGGDLDSELRDLRRDMMEREELPNGTQLASLPNPQSARPLPKLPWPQKSPEAMPKEVKILDALARLGDAFPQASIGTRELALMYSGFDEGLAYMRMRQDFNPRMGLKAMMSRHQSPVLASHPALAATHHMQDPKLSKVASAEEIDEQDTRLPLTTVSHLDAAGFQTGDISSRAGFSDIATLEKFHDESLTLSNTPRAFSSVEPSSKRRKVEHKTASTNPSRHDKITKFPSSIGPPVASPSDNTYSTSSNFSSSSDTGALSPEKAYSVKTRSSYSRIGDNEISGDDSSSNSSSEQESSNVTSSESLELTGHDITSSSDTTKPDRDREGVSDSDSSSVMTSSRSDLGSRPENMSSQQLPETEPGQALAQFSASNGASSTAKIMSGLLSPHRTMQATVKQGATEVRVPPGQGLRRTRKRNARRRVALKAKRAAADQASQVSSRLPDKENRRDTFAEIEARRQALLGAVSSSGPDEPASAPTKFSIHCNQDSTTDEQSTAIDVSFASTQPTMRTTLYVSSASFQASQNGESQGTLNREKLASPRVSAAPTATVEQHESVLTRSCDDESWKTKISLSAVECCHDNVVLRRPPFPFFQRWDPQQRSYHTGKRGGKSKTAKRNSSHFYGHDGWSKGKKRKLDAAMDEPAPVTLLNYDEPTGHEAGCEETAKMARTDAFVDKYQSPNEGGSQFTDMDDLPSLPADLTTLSTLNPGQAKVGMVITWKEYVLNSATNWQPEILDLTGTVVNVTDGTPELNVVLARRDLRIVSPQKTFDDNGNRVYEKFEAIDFDDKENDSDDGYRVLDFAKMREPRIVQLPIEADGGENPRESYFAEGGADSTVVNVSEGASTMHAAADQDQGSTAFSAENAIDEAGIPNPNKLSV